MNFFAHQDRARRGSRYYTLLTSVIVLGPALLWGLSTETIDDVGWAEICVAMLLFISVSYWFLNRKLKDGGPANGRPGRHPDTAGWLYRCRHLIKPPASARPARRATSSAPTSAPTPDVPLSIMHKKTAPEGAVLVS